MDTDMQVYAGEMRRLVERVIDGAGLAFAARDHSRDGFLKGAVGAWIAEASRPHSAGSPERAPSTFFAARRVVMERALSFHRRRPVISYHVLLGGARRVVWTRPENRPRERGQASAAYGVSSGVAVDVFFGYTDLPAKAHVIPCPGRAVGALAWAAAGAWLVLDGAFMPAAVVFFFAAAWSAICLAALACARGRRWTSRLAGPFTS